MNSKLTYGQSWHHTTATRPTSVVPAYGFGMGDVCVMTRNENSGLTAKRHAAATPATFKGLQPWSPPVT
jgi:hypothetical protein